MNSLNTLDLIHIYIYNAPIFTCFRMSWKQFNYFWKTSAKLISLKFYSIWTLSSIYYFSILTDRVNSLWPPTNCRRHYLRRHYLLVKMLISNETRKSLEVVALFSINIPIFSSLLKSIYLTVSLSQLQKPIIKECSFYDIRQHFKFIVQLEIKKTFS